MKIDPDTYPNKTEAVPTFETASFIFLAGVKILYFGSILEFI